MPHPTNEHPIPQPTADHPIVCGASGATLGNDATASAFLGEIGDINAFIVDALACPKKWNWHWPTFYLMYVEVDRLLGLIGQLEHHFASPFAGFGEPPTPEEAADDANALFAQLTRRQKALLGSLFQLSRYTQPDDANPALHRRLTAHVHPKSGWHQVFLDEYRSGAVSSDGKTLTRTVLPVDTAPDCERIDHIAAGCMLRQQRFDLDAPGMATALAQSASQAASRLGTIAGAMHAHLVQNCTIHDLMHPSSY
jgi:hypothetical protein